MKKPIKINSDRTPLTNEEIKQHQNFKATWQKQYKKPKPLYKNPKFFGGLIMIICLIAVILIETFEKKEATPFIKQDSLIHTAAPIDTVKNEVNTNKIANDSVVQEEKESELK